MTTNSKYNKIGTKGTIPMEDLRKTYSLHQAKEAREFFIKNLITDCGELGLTRTIKYVRIRKTCGIEYFECLIDFKEGAAYYQYFPSTKQMYVIGRQYPISDKQDLLMKEALIRKASQVSNSLCQPKE